MLKFFFFFLFVLQNLACAPGFAIAFFNVTKIEKGWSIGALAAKNSLTRRKESLNFSP
jgi:hypothetical protein